MKSEPIYVTGHQRPDTDSIASAIAYAFYKRAQGFHAVPCRLGPLNPETEYLLNRFGFEAPRLLTDARVRLSEIALDPPTYITPDTTIYESLQFMQKEKRTYCGVVDSDMHLVGLVTKSDISVVGLGDTSMAIHIMASTPLENIRKTIDGVTVYDDPEMKLNGKVSIITMTNPENMPRYDIKGRIVLVGDHPATQKAAIQQGAGLLVVVWAKEIQEDVIQAAKENHCPIIISGHGTMNTSRYIYFSPSVKQIMKHTLITFKDNELVEDVGTKLLRSQYRIYPVVDSENQLKGYISRYHVMNSLNKQLVLVDHNEFSQSVRAVEKARILEVIDHHRINDFASMQPVQFRNEIVGSTATVIATIFRENQIPIPTNLAGLLLGAVLSDTMNFHSPTTTPKDKATANILAALADLDIEEFAGEMFSVTANTEGKTIPDMINQDMKIFDIHGCKVSISQIIVRSTADMIKSTNGILIALEEVASKKRLNLSVAVFTSVIENGSIVFGAGDRAEWVKEAFPNASEEEHSFQPGLLSRKQQILPQLTNTISHYL